ncbi:coiled-coil domain-containing protein [Cytobacillus kochii]|uniref:coiled-coil domain-containing protein n=1 Tax=Cytobacillus kochii TaxID=859143 RepID=UPI001CD6493B|nr:hypothetical protein [Cytobacillus kochii]MCA1028841.1 hypothetical protein [Cytobacillus kochii]
MFSKKKSSKKHGQKYKKMVYILGAVFLFFLTSRIIFNIEGENEDTPLRTPVAFSNTEVEIASKEFYMDENLLEVDVIVKQKGSVTPLDLSVDVIEKSDTEKQYKTEITKITEEYYVIFVHDLPDKWKSVSMIINDKNDENSSSLSMASKLYVSQEKTEKIEVFSVKKSDYYEAKYIDTLLDDTKKMITKDTDSINKAKADIKKIEEKISSLEAEQEFQTRTEKENTRQNIASLQTNIDALNSEKKKLNDNLKEYQERIEKLKERKSKLVY